ncbi:hypothetical protein [Pelagovum pacificum]|uniref:Uncharacterized protein n=1 Tax=Pelagovum pacificum TaxID=2588711 RepID=A0A5C5GBF6_9RHOB|nr:hypothetical protein [Pelagovum pacificum]QQA42204.1 hypothetical protein I8N54_15605 [Pelagovum pacificum]TNY31290.1 hypothetical protein FHY64_14790 [Pelagovum pacificum]
MTAIPLALTTLISIWALATSDVAVDVLMMVALLSAGLLMLQSILNLIWPALSMLFVDRRMQAQIMLARALSANAASDEADNAFTALVTAYDLRPGEHALEDDVEYRDAELERLKALFVDLSRAARLLPDTHATAGVSDVRAGLAARIDARPQRQAYLSLMAEAEWLSGEIGGPRRTTANVDFAPKMAASA